MREEVVEQTVDEDAKEAAELILEQKRNLKSRQGQSFQVFHPEAAKALGPSNPPTFSSRKRSGQAPEDRDSGAGSIPQHAGFRPPPGGHAVGGGELRLQQGRRNAVEDQLGSVAPEDEVLLADGAWPLLPDRCG